MIIVFILAIFIVFHMMNTLLFISLYFSIILFFYDCKFFKKASRLTNNNIKHDFIVCYSIKNRDYCFFSLKFVQYFIIFNKILILIFNTRLWKFSILILPFKIYLLIFFIHFWARNKLIYPYFIIFISFKFFHLFFLT